MSIILPARVINVLSPSSARTVSWKTSMYIGIGSEMVECAPRQLLGFVSHSSHVQIKMQLDDVHTEVLFRRQSRTRAFFNGWEVAEKDFAAARAWQA